jgi:hypothetical protein
MGKYTDRIREIKGIIGGDEQANKFIENVVIKAIDYIRQIERAERILSIHSNSYDFKDKFDSADKLRTIKHNALISDLNIANRYLFKEYGDVIPVGGLFVGPVEQFHQREIIGDWAVELVNEIRHEQVDSEAKRETEVGHHGGSSARL